MEIKLLVTGHSELGNCSWCTDGNGKLLKFIIRQCLDYKKALKDIPGVGFEKSKETILPNIE